MYIVLRCQVDFFNSTRQADNIRHILAGDIQMKLNGNVLNSFSLNNKSKKRRTKVGHAKSNMCVFATTRMMTGK